MTKTITLTLLLLLGCSFGQTTGKKTSELTARALVAGDKVIVTTAAGANAAGNVGDDVIALQAEDTRTDNPHAVTQTQVGLPNVDNTSDVNKPVSSAAQTALDDKVNIATAPISPEDYSGTDQQKLVAALAEATSSGRPVDLQAKTYTLTERLDAPSGVVINGNGATLDGSATAASGFTDGLMVQFQSGVVTSLADTSAPITKGTQTVVLASAPSLVQGDIIIIADITDFSYSGHKASYKAGEFAVVQSVSGSTITTLGRLYADYAAGMRVAKQSSGRLVVRDLTMIAPSDPVIGTVAVEVSHSNYPLFENVEANGGSHTSMVFRKVYGAAIVNCSATEDGSNDYGTDYALSLGNSQSVRVTGGVYRASRHAIAIGGNADPWAVVNRDILISGVLTDSNSTLQSIDCHGNSEYIRFTDSVLKHGVKLSGNYNSVTNNRISSTGTVAVLIAEASGLDYMIDGNVFELGEMITSRGAAIDLGGNGGGLTADTPSGGTMQILDNHIIVNEATDSTGNFLRIFNQGYAGAEPIRALVQGNTMENRGAGALGAAVRVSRTSGSEWNQFSLIGNTINNASVITLASVLAPSPSAQAVIIEGNTAAGGSAAAILVNHVSDTLRIASNSLDRMRYGGIQVSGSSSAKVRNVNIENNQFLGSLMRVTASSTTNTFAYVTWVDYLRVCNNYAGNAQVKLTLTGYTGTFAVGEAVTGGTSGATGVVTSVEASLIYVSTDIDSAAFTAEAVTGGTSGATATASALNTLQRFAYAADSNTFWHSSNISYPTTVVLTDRVGVINP